MIDNQYLETLIIIVIKYLIRIKVNLNHKTILFRRLPFIIYIIFFLFFLQRNKNKTRTKVVLKNVS